MDDKKYTRICKCCGIEFATNINRAVLCSAECRKRQKTLDKTARNKAKLDVFRQEKPCLVCLNVFKPIRVDSNFCSASCRSKHTRAKRKKHNIEQNILCKISGCNKPVHLTGFCHAHYAASKYIAKPVKQGNCLHCGKEFIYKKSKKFCSAKCGYTYKARLNGVKPAHRLKEVVCKECKCTFKPRRIEFSTFCSRDCSISYQTKHGIKRGNSWESQKTCSARRKQRMKANGFERINKTKVFERDKWTCHICGCKTPKSKRGTIEMDAPEVDHIIPLAAGGSHTYSNVACACKRCNIKKSTKPLGQLNFGII